MNAHSKRRSRKTRLVTITVPADRADRVLAFNSQLDEIEARDSAAYRRIMRKLNQLARQTGARRAA